MKYRPSFSLIAVALAVGGGIWSACEQSPGPTPATDPVPSRPPSTTVEGVGEAVTGHADLVHLVKQGPCGPEGDGYARWIEEELVRAGGTLMFADWEVRAGYGGFDEVWFVYTLLDARYRVLVGAYAWRVGRDDRAVGVPQRFEPSARTGPPGT